jgi:hypothetical protein
VTPVFFVAGRNVVVVVAVLDPIRDYNLGSHFAVIYQLLFIVDLGGI